MATERTWTGCDYLGPARQLSKAALSKAALSPAWAAGAPRGAEGRVAMVPSCVPLLRAHSGRVDEAVNMLPVKKQHSGYP